MIQNNNFKHINDFDAIKVSIASPEEMLDWSHGEVLKAETINYRTLRPEVDGLMCERIFGPVKNYECHCGKYKGIRYKGIVCDKCGVEITHRRVRRQRMGHIKLAVPVTHVWFAYGVPNKLSIILDVLAKDLISVVYYSKYMVTEVDEAKKKEAIVFFDGQIDSVKKELKEEKDKEIQKIEKELDKEISKLKKGNAEKINFQKEQLRNKHKQKIAQINSHFFNKEKEKIEELNRIKKLVERININTVITEEDYDHIVEMVTPFFQVEMGAIAIQKVLGKIDLDTLADSLRVQMKDRSKHKRMKAIKRLHLVDGFRNNSTRPEWLVLETLPVLPPELRPIIQLPGGRFATADLNDLYRRVINRNNRLKRLIEIGAPDIILRNEKRMLQEAVDALIDNNHRPATAVLNQRKQPYKSLSENLRGKRGRFRQNLLGKRVDYSGRSVIVGDAALALDHCGLPRAMALEIFKPFVIRELIGRGIAPNIKSARNVIESLNPVIWDILEELVKERPVLLNRAPTLHKHGILGFYPILVDGNAIRINPLVCDGFNADFDGDQMAVHLPLTEEAVEEARDLMLARHNILKLADGKSLVTPKKDMVLGLYYMSGEKEGQEKPVGYYYNEDTAITAYELGMIDVNDKIIAISKGEKRTTSVGKILVNRALPAKYPYVTARIDAKEMEILISSMITTVGIEETVIALDALKSLGFDFVTRSGYSFSVSDIIEHPEKDKIIEMAKDKEKELDGSYNEGLMTLAEKKKKTEELWEQTTDQLSDMTWSIYSPGNPIYDIITSKTNGSLVQLKQISSIKGLLLDPTGKYVEMPILSNFKTGLSAFEYFTNSRGARKGLADTALRTAKSGYLTRKLVIVSEGLITREDDCGQKKEGYTIKKSFNRRIDFHDTIAGRIPVKDVVDPKTGEVFASAHKVITLEQAMKIDESGVQEVTVRSPLTCEATMGICTKCYGHDLGTHEMVKKGKAVGVIAAQAMGEQSTQLTLRTFHFGGAQKSDITQGVARMEELFEARTPKGIAYVADFAGKVSIAEEERGKKFIILRSMANIEKEFPVAEDDHPTMKKTKTVKMGDVLYVRSNGTEVIAPFAGTARLLKNKIVLAENETVVKTYQISEFDKVIVETGQKVEAGQALTMGSIDPKVIMKIRGLRAAQEYIIDEIQKIFSGQGVAIDEKHVELIARMMGIYVQIIDPGDTTYTPGQFAHRRVVETKNKILKEKGLKIASYVEHLLGITNASLRTESFLSAMAFQEQVRVLTEASILGKVDHLRGLMENVIIGRLIPVGERAEIEDISAQPEFRSESDMKSEVIAAPEEKKTQKQE